MDLSVITVTWNSQEIIAEQIHSVILGCNKISYEQIIVDNNSTDQTIEFIQKQFPLVKLISNKKNIGFGAANNQGAKIAEGKYLLFLNPDMRVERSGLDKMVTWMDEHPETGIAGCELVNERGQFNEHAKPRRFPTFWDQLAIVLKIPRLFPGVLNNYLYHGFDANKEQRVDSIRGAFFFVRRVFMDKLGFAFDPRYFIWFEDVDTCREARRLGYTVMYTPVTTCVDKVGMTFKKRNFFWKQFQFIRSMIKYFWKWGLAR